MSGDERRINCFPPCQNGVIATQNLGKTISPAKFFFMSSRTRLFGVGAAANSSDARRFCLRVQFVDLLLVALLDDAAAEF